MANKIEHKIIHGTMKEVEAKIFDLEQDGWELITVLLNTHHHGQVAAFFKRAKKEKGIFG